MIFFLLIKILSAFVAGSILFSTSIFSVPASLQWQDAWKNTNAHGLSYNFPDLDEVWHQGVSFAIVGKLNTTADSIDVISIYGRPVDEVQELRCRLILDIKHKVAMTMSADSKGKTNYMLFSYFPYKRSNELIDFEVIVERLAWPGGFLFYINKEGPLYPCFDSSFSSILGFEWYSGFTEYSTFKSAFEGDFMNRYYSLKKLNNRYEILNEHYLSYGNVDIDLQSGKNAFDRRATKYLSWPSHMKLRVTNTGYGVVDPPLSFLSSISLYGNELGDVDYCIEVAPMVKLFSVWQSRSKYRIHDSYNFTSPSVYMPMNTWPYQWSFEWDKKTFGYDVYVDDKLWSQASAFTISKYSRFPTSVASSYKVGQTNYFTGQASASSIDCTYTPWNEWSSCSTSCLGGTMYRIRYPLRAPSAGGLDCMQSVETVGCNFDTNCVSCIYDVWSQWSECSTSCGGGTQFRVRQLKETKLPPCDENEKETVLCNIQMCPVHCRISQWSPWSLCSASCGGDRRRYRYIVEMPYAGGKLCPEMEDLSEFAKCDDACTGVCEAPSADGTERCKNNSKCINYPNNDFICVCPDGFFGRNCEITSSNYMNQVVGGAGAGVVALLCLGLWRLSVRSRNAAAATY